MNLNKILQEKSRPERVRVLQGGLDRVDSLVIYVPVDATLCNNVPVQSNPTISAFNGLVKVITMLGFDSSTVVYSNPQDVKNDLEKTVTVLETSYNKFIGEVSDEEFASFAKSFRTILALFGFAKNSQIIKDYLDSVVILKKTLI